MNDADQTHLDPEGTDTMSHSRAQGERQGQIRPEKSATRVPVDSMEPRGEDDRPDEQFVRGGEAQQPASEEAPQPEA